MASMPLALSVHKLISSVGADAGFASVVGLAILALLYFAHARETANLRDEASVLAQRLQEAEDKLDAARRVQPMAPAPAPVAPAPSSAGAPIAVPFAPAGLGAPALASATHFRSLSSLGAVQAPVPAAVPAASSIKVSRVVGPPSTAPGPGVAETEAASAPGAPAGPVAPAPAPAEPAPSAAPTPPPPSPAAQPVLQPPVPAPAPAAVAAFRTAPATVAGAAGERTAPAPTNGASSAPVASPEPIVPLPPPVQAPRPPRPPRRTAGRDMFVSSRSRGSSPIGRRFAVLIGFLVVLGAVAAVVIATSGTGSPSSSRGSGPSSTPTSVKPLFNPALVTVAVLNGTNTNQLAHHVADRLTSQGFKQGLVATASNQTLPSTIVGYLPGSKNRADALRVAKALHLPRGSVAPVDQAAQAVACPPPGACTANVIVTVGANLATGF